MKLSRILWLLLLLPLPARAQSPAQRRQAVLQATSRGAAGLPALQAAMKDDNAVVRRTALRGLVALGAAGAPALQAALANDQDEVVRMGALQGLSRLSGTSLPELLKAGMADKSFRIRRVAVNLLVGIEPRTPEVLAAIKQAAMDNDQQVAGTALQAVFPLRTPTRSARERREFRDQQLNVVQTIPLPLKGWKFQTDPKQTGYEDGWSKAGFDDSAWKPIEIGKFWDDFGITYLGIAWYRGTFTLPAKPAALDAVDLSFGAVDETAWIWINGEFAGLHDIGPGGWDQPFSVDVTNLLKWGQPNQMTVRVLNRAYGGGIWRPVNLEVLKK